MANMRKAKAAALGLLLLIGCGHAFSDPDRSADRGTDGSADAEPHQGGGILRRRAFAH